MLTRKQRWRRVRGPKLYSPSSADDSSNIPASATTTDDAAVAAAVAAAAASNPGRHHHHRPIDSLSIGDSLLHLLCSSSAAAAKNKRAAQDVAAVKVASIGRVRFNQQVRVVLVPSRIELQSLKNDVWWGEEDYCHFRHEYILAMRADLPIPTEEDEQEDAHEGEEQPRVEDVATATDAFIGSVDTVVVPVAEAECLATSFSLPCEPPQSSCITRCPSSATAAVPLCPPKVGAADSLAIVASTTVPMLCGAPMTVSSAAEATTANDETLSTISHTSKGDCAGTDTVASGPVVVAPIPTNFTGAAAAAVKLSTGFEREDDVNVGIGSNDDEDCNNGVMDLPLSVQQKYAQGLDREIGRCIPRLPLGTCGDLEMADTSPAAGGMVERPTLLNRTEGKGLDDEERVSILPHRDGLSNLDQFVSAEPVLSERDRWDMSVTAPAIRTPAAVIKAAAGNDLDEEDEGYRTQSMSSSSEQNDREYSPDESEIGGSDNEGCWENDKKTPLSISERRTEDMLASKAEATKNVHQKVSPKVM